ncbi:glycosyltransferase [Siphonobacter sp. SORGH_AS_1065]|uniref:glycosyltransferase n=2 Tax=unclassified Siphonobacter TaxID=2635712 RepID=UPI002785E6C7|nr:glycosyltransferase [Siphonobacter sp. SORGH_AS_1065]MDQ1086917.1 hypothetical protein [Siphonobacter sp. SORGH_AS_1065]
MKALDSIICIGQTPWQGEFQNSAVQLLTELSNYYRVLYVDYQYTLKDMVMGVTGRRNVPMQKLVNRKGVLTKVEENRELYVWLPPVMAPVNWMSDSYHDTFLQINTKRLTNGLREVMKELRMQSPLIINAFNPVQGLPLLHKLGEVATIYYCFDEISAEAWMGKHGARYEKKYLKAVDAVVTTSEALQQFKSQEQPRTFCVKNGANFDLFYQAHLLKSQKPKSENKTIGYLGTADNRIDGELVERCVQDMPQHRFEFLGPVNDDTLKERLSGYSNVIFTPSKRPEELPQALSEWDAAMIPFVCNEHTYTIYPLKINEYLAAGLPVVTTPFSILKDFEDIVSIESTAEAFSKSLQKALESTDPVEVKQRIEMARGNSWAHRAKEFRSIIEQIVDWKLVS